MCFFQLLSPQTDSNLRFSFDAEISNPLLVLPDCQQCRDRLTILAFQAPAQISAFLLSVSLRRFSAFRRHDSPSRELSGRDLLRLASKSPTTWACATRSTEAALGDNRCCLE